MFEALTDKFNQVMTRMRGLGKITDSNIEPVLRDVRLALLEADVHVGVVREFLEKIKARALGSAVRESMTPAQEFMKIVHEELVSILGGSAKPFVFSGKSPHVVMMVGLQGAGKTTTTGKLANYFKSKGRRPYLVPLDVRRPAAIEQLKILGRQIEVPVYDTKEGDKPVKIARKAIDAAADAFCDVVFLDTAGRLNIDEELMDELKTLQKKLDHPQILFVADAMTGQEAVKVAKSFHELLKIDGLILTKMDGDAKGGAALSVQSVAGCPIYFMGMGEKTADIEPFEPEKLVARLLDRGDLMGLVEKAQSFVSEEEALGLAKKIKQNRFTIEDFKSQLKQVKKMGSMQSLMKMIPGARAMTKDVDFDAAQKEMARKEAIINSMTRQERLNPQILNGSRRLRIAKGSGTQVSDVNRFLKEFEQMQKMFKMFKSGNKGLLKNLMGGMG